MNHCIDCGAPTGGIRCRPCNGRYERDRAVVRMTDVDRELLRQVDEEGLTAPRLAIRLGISRTRAYVKIREARERETLRKEKEDGSRKGTLQAGAQDAARPLGRGGLGH